MKNFFKIAVAILAVLLLMLTVGCAAGPDDQKQPEGEKPIDEEPTDKDDTVAPILENFDASKEYPVPDYTKFNPFDYVTLGKYRNLTLTLDEKNYAVTDAQIDSQIEKILQENHPGAKITDRATAWNDTVVVSFCGKIDGVAFDGGTAKNQTIELTEENANHYIPGFIEGIVGVTPGVDTDILATFGEDYGVESLNGKTATFTINVSYIVGHPEATDDFIKEYTKGDFETVAAYRVYLKATQEAAAYDDLLYETLWSKIAENAAVIKYDTDAVMYYYGYYYDMYSYYAAMNGLPYELFLQINGMSAATLFEYCKTIVKANMVRTAVMREVGAECTEEEYRAYLEKYVDDNYDLVLSSASQEMEGDLTRDDLIKYMDDNFSDMLKENVRSENLYHELLKTTTVNVIPMEETVQQ